MSDTPTLRAALHKTFLLNGPKPFLGYREPLEAPLASGSEPSSGGYKWLTYNEVFQKTYEVAFGMQNVLKLLPKSSVAICCDNRPDWLICDFACCLNQYMCLGLMTGWDDATMSFVLKKADVECIICKSSMLPVFRSILDRAEAGEFKVKFVVVIEDGPTRAVDLIASSDSSLKYEIIAYHSLSNALNGKQVSPLNLLKTEGGLLGSTEKSERDTMQDPYTLLFTSGTTGRPKGVAVSKLRWKRDAEGSPFGGQDSPAVISYMSLAHGGDRGICWQACLNGARIGLSLSGGSLDPLLRDMQEVKPSFFLGMSHLWSDFFSLFNRELENRTVPAVKSFVVKAMRKYISDLPIEKGVDVSVVESLCNSEDSLIKLAKELPEWKLFIEAAAKLLGIRDFLLIEWNERFGGSVISPITGGGHTSAEVIAWMGDVFTPRGKDGSVNISNVKNAYGASEFPGISVNGDVSESIELVLEPLKDMPQSFGEIVVRTKDRNIRTEYYKDPESTLKAFSPEGWYRTGDIGEFVVKDGVKTNKLRIVDRVSNMLELYINGDSVWVQQSRLESENYSTSQGIDKLCLVCDRNQDYIIAVVCPSWSFVKAALSPDILTLIQGLDLAKQREIAYSQQSVIDAVLNSLKSSGRQFNLQPYEIPGAVILDVDDWTPENGLLTPTYKPRRDKLRTKFQTRMEEIYSPHMKDSAKPPPSSSSTNATASQAQANENEVVATIATLISSKSCKETITIEFKSILELCVVMPTHFGSILKDIELTVGPKSVANLGLPLAWAGYIDQNLKSLPYITPKKQDFLGCFSFIGPNEHASLELNSILAELKVEAHRRLDCWGQWSETAQAVKTLALEKRQSALKSSTEIVNFEFQLIQDRVQSYITRENCDENESFSSLLDSLVKAITTRYYVVEMFSSEAKSVRPVDEKLQSMSKYQQLLDKLVIIASRMGVKVPFQIEAGQWLSNEKTIENFLKESSTLATSLGNAEVKCSMSGDVIEEDCFTMGKPRWHCLDAAGIDRSEESHELANKLLDLLCKFRNHSVKSNNNAILEEVDSLFNKYQISRFFNPTGMKIEDLVLGSEHCNRKCIWVIENAHFWQLRNQCNKEYSKGDFETPAGFMSRCLSTWGNRLALGIPDSDFISPETCPLARAPKLLHAAGISLVKYRNYNWITYKDLNVLVMQVAKIIRSKVPRGSFVGIVGYNNIEWAVCDLACAMAGCVIVGMHTTYDVKSAHYVMSLSQVSLVLCTKDIVGEGASNGDFWTLDRVIEYETSQTESPKQLNVQHVCVIDEETALLPPQNIASSKIDLSSLIDSIENEAMSSVWQHIVLESADEQPSSDSSSLFTLLFTSGSTGNPKAVMISAAAFMRDISSRVFVEPLSTVSYIPLSHSSDRMKLWEFLGNGGRVGFAYFSASNWLDHETSKKTEAIQGSVSSSNGVEPLFHQVKMLGPSSMAAPPNIASGLYYLYLSKLQQQISSFSSFSASSSSAIDAKSAEKLARENVAAMFGPNIKFVSTGGGPTAAVVFQFLKDALGGIAGVSDSYGATEVGAICQDNVPMAPPNVKSVRFRVVDFDTGHEYSKAGEIGEAWASSKSISSGYFLDPVQTAAAFVQDGTDSDGQPIVWYKTGDLVKIVEEGPRDAGFWKPKIQILGRIASAVRLSSGKLVSPDVLEGVFCASLLLSNIYIHGRSDCDRLVAVVAVNWDHAKINNMASLREEIMAEIDRVSRENNLNESETPTKVLVHVGEWSIENGLLNGSMKKNRKEFAKRFETALNELHDK